jgi:hypothetical protein
VSDQKHDLERLAFIWRWLPPNRKDEARKLVRVTRGGEDVWLPSRELSVADVTSLHAMCKAAEIHATKAKRRNSVR